MTRCHWPAGTIPVPWIRISIKILLAGSIMIGSAQAQQNPGQEPPRAPAAKQVPDTSNPCSGRVSERAFLKNLWCDQKTMWRAPLHSGSHLRFILPVAGATAALIATDRSVGREFSERPPATAFHASRDISYMGSTQGVIGFTGALYGIALLTHNERTRETALLSFETLADTGIVQEILKVTTQRERPSQTDGQPRIDDARGKFWAGGSSFPSGHAMSAWALAAMFASRYPNKPALKYGAYGLAALISTSRLTARQHFPSDVLVGSLLGYLIGHYVARAHRR
jgi:membrane-associated phospholipid phosphatase